MATSIFFSRRFPSCTDVFYPKFMKVFVHAHKIGFLAYRLRYNCACSEDVDLRLALSEVFKAVLVVKNDSINFAYNMI